MLVEGLYITSVLLLLIYHGTITRGVMQLRSCGCISVIYIGLEARLLILILSKAGPIYLILLRLSEHWDFRTPKDNVILLVVLLIVQYFQVP